MSKFFFELNPLKSQIIVFYCIYSTIIYKTLYYILLYYYFVFILNYAIVFCNDVLKRHLNINGFFLRNSCRRFCDTVRNLGFTLDTHLTLEQQVKQCDSSVILYLHLPKVLHE